MAVSDRVLAAGVMAVSDRVLAAGVTPVSGSPAGCV